LILNLTGDQIRFSAKKNKTINCDLAGRDPANSARVWHKPLHWRLNPRDFQDPDSPGSSRACRMDWTCTATRRRPGLNHLSQCFRHWLPARDNKALGPGDKPIPTLQRHRPTSHPLRSKNHCTSPSSLRRTYHLRAPDSPDNK